MKQHCWHHSKSKNLYHYRTTATSASICYGININTHPSLSCKLLQEVLLWWLQESSVLVPERFQWLKSGGKGLQSLQALQYQALSHAIQFPWRHRSGYQASTAVAQFFLNGKSQSILCFLYSNLHRYLHSCLINAFRNKSLNQNMPAAAVHMQQHCCNMEFHGLVIILPCGVGDKCLN